MKNFEEGEILENVNHSVFITIYSRKIKKIKSIKREIPGVIVIFRSDGRLGFPGGKVESTDYEGKLTTDGLKNAVIRETYEEIGYKIKNKDLIKFESSTLINKNHQITSFSLLVTDEELNNIYRNYSNHVDTYYCKTEIYGINRLYFSDSRVKANILNQNFKSIAKYEMDHLLKKYF